MLYFLADVSEHLVGSIAWVEMIKKFDHFGPEYGM